MEYIFKLIYEIFMESIFAVIYHWFHKILKHKVSEKTAKQFLV